MPRLRNKANGVVVNVDDELAAAMVGGGWEPAGKLAGEPDGKPAKETAAQKRKREAAEKAERERAEQEQAAAVEAWLEAEREFVAAGGTAGGE